MNSANPLSQRRQRRSDEILAAARDAFLAKGFQGTAVSEIANRVGVVEGLVFSYFPTKRDLLHAVLCDMYEPLIKEVGEGYSRLKGLRARLRFIIWRHLRVFFETPGLAKLVLHEVRMGSEYDSSGLHLLQVRYTQFVRLAIDDAVRDGELPDATDVETVRSMLYGGLEHLMWPVLTGKSQANVDLIADRFTELIMHGIQGSRNQGDARNEGARRDERDIDTRLSRLEAIISATKPGVILGR